MLRRDIHINFRNHRVARPSPSDCDSEAAVEANWYDAFARGSLVWDRFGLALRC